MLVGKKHEKLLIGGDVIKNPVARYLMASYAYYVEDDPIMTDGEFDELCKNLLEDWDKIDHPHKANITKSDLEAGTFLGEYPTIVKFALKSYRNSLTSS